MNRKQSPLAFSLRTATMGLGIELDGTLHWVQAKRRHDVHAQPYMYIYLLTRRASMPVIFVEEEVEEEG
jgi:hypothetical protein